LTDTYTPGEPNFNIFYGLSLPSSQLPAGYGQITPYQHVGPDSKYHKENISRALDYYHKHCTAARQIINCSEQSDVVFLFSESSKYYCHSIYLSGTFIGELVANHAREPLAHSSFPSRFKYIVEMKSDNPLTSLTRRQLLTALHYVCTSSAPFHGVVAHPSCYIKEKYYTIEFDDFTSFFDEIYALSKSMHMEELYTCSLLFFVRIY